MDEGVEPTTLNIEIKGLVEQKTAPVISFSNKEPLHAIGKCFWYSSL